MIGCSLLLWVLHVGWPASPPASSCVMVPVTLEREVGERGGGRRGEEKWSNETRT